ncbi:MAG: hypothetical protein GDA56_02960 [Hormoscilla sp. GM7CHS1pb]|nr:hypothetical protein [Hormoscilla sp. GM7CHS1pb]
MRGITIMDRQPDSNRLAVNLIDILEQLGSAIATTEWKISDVECIGQEADLLHEISDTQRIVSGITLLQIARNIIQVIDGTFAGYQINKSEPWIIIEAVDSSAYDVDSNEETILTKLRQRFINVENLPESETQPTETQSIQSGSPATSAPMPILGVRK